MRLPGWLGGKGANAVRDASLDRWWDQEVTIGAVTVTAGEAVRAGAVFPIIAGLAEIFASVPFEMKGPEGAAPHPLMALFGRQPNALHTAEQFWSTMVFNSLLRGASYAEPTVASTGELEVWPLRPTQLNEDHGERRFAVDYRYESGMVRRFGPADLFRITGLSEDGVRAFVPYRVASAAIEMANTLDRFGRNFFRNGARPSGVLSTDQALKPDAVKRLQEEFNGNFAGVLNSGKVPVLEQALKYLPVANSNVDSQLVELSREEVRRVARFWRYPLHMLGESDGKKNDEQASQEFVKYTVRPLARRIEQCIRRDLLRPDEQDAWEPKFNLDGLLRGDSATQWRNAVLARTATVASINELRVGWFNLSRIDEPWADDPREPLNSNRAADTIEGGMTAPHDREDA